MVKKVNTFIKFFSYLDLKENTFFITKYYKPAMPLNKLHLKTVPEAHIIGLGSLRYLVQDERLECCF